MILYDHKISHHQNRYDTDPLCHAIDKSNIVGFTVIILHNLISKIKKDFPKNTKKSIEHTLGRHILHMK